MAQLSMRRARTAAGRRNVAARVASTPLPAQFKTVKPSGDRVLIKLGTAERETASGILLPTAAEVEKNEGAVVAVGDGKNVTLKEGDQVMFGRYAGTKVEVADEEHALMAEADVLGVKGASIADMQPLEDRVVIRVAEGETSSSGGVILTSQSAEKPTIGEVVAVGPGKKGEDGALAAVNCKPGEQVMYGRYSGQELEEDDTMYVVVREPEILAVLS